MARKEHQGEAEFIPAPLLERRHDMLTRSEYMETQLEIRDDIKQILTYQRETNGKVATAFERLATLEERTQNIKDSHGRTIGYTSLILAVITFVISLIKASPAVAK